MAANAPNADTTQHYKYFDVFLLLQPCGQSGERGLPEFGNENDLYAELQTILSPRLTLSGFSPLSPRIAYSCCHAEAPLHLSDLLQLREIRTTPNLKDFEHQKSADVVLLPTHPECLPSGQDKAVRPLKLAVFDMDSTLIDQEVIDELAREVGVYEAVGEITERAMRGELDFTQSLRARVALLKGVRADVWEYLPSRINFAEGARELCRALKRLGVRMAVLSGGFTPMAQWAKCELGLDVAHANFLETSAATEEIPYPHLTGNLILDKPIVSAALKKELLLSLAQSYGISMSETLCVGDGANDLQMLGAVGEGGGLAIAFKAKEKVQLEAPNKLNSQSLVDILYLLGFTRERVEELIAE